MKQTAIKAAKVAGKVMLDNYGNIGKISFKESKKSLLTQIDLKSEKAIIETIKKKFPGHNIISEESGTQNQNSEYSWIIDPIDGTTNYAQNIPNFCVSIALAKNKKVILGVVYEPLRKELFFAEKGKGAFLNKKKIKVSDKKNMDDAIFGFSIPSETQVSVNTLHRIAEIFPLVRGIRNSGSAALNLCSVACGRYDSYFSKFINSWDVAAGFLIVEEAGGQVTDLKNKLWDISKKQIAASNKKLHDKVLNLLR
ncbi:inositol monophosphatase [Candidatus Woesearchaeota archaeon]|nr:inositol monophosphatase [Candidatus Woesearchaeota archaeon]